MLLINEWVNNEIKDEIKIYLNTNEDVDTKIQKSVELWESNPKREIHSIIGLSQKQKTKKKTQEKAQMNNLTLHLEELEEQQTKPKVSRRKEIIKIRAEINEIESKKTIQKTNESKSWFFEKSKKIDKPLTRLIKNKREMTQINKIRNERGKITTDTKEIQRILRIYYEQLCANKLDNLDEMDKFLETHNLPKLNQEESENLNRQITPSEIEAVLKKTPNKCP